MTQKGAEEQMSSSCLGMECGYCREQCSAYKLVSLESATSRGKARILDSYLKGKLPLKELSRFAYFCTRCGYCGEVCPEGEGVEEYILQLRQELVTQELEPKVVREKAHRLLEEGTPHPKRDRSWEELAEKKDLKSKRAYFPGCNILANQPELAKKSYRLLQDLGVRARPLTDLCCGSALMNTGYLKDWRTMAKENLAMLKREGIRELILSCGGGCLRMFGRDYQRFLGASIPVVHMEKLLVDNIKKLEGRWKRPESKDKIIYHDSCAMGRAVVSHQHSRTLLAQSDLPTLEFDSNREDTLCCGGGGGLSTIWTKEAKLLSLARTQEAGEKGATILVSGCPTCRSRFKAVKKDKTLKVLDIVELLK